MEYRNENENVVIARCGIQCMRGICHKDVGELSRDDDWMQRKGREYKSRREDNENEKGGKSIMSY